MARPNSASLLVKSFGCTQPRMAGPTSRPRTISKTTSGIWMNLATGGQQRCEHGAAGRAISVEMLTTSMRDLAGRDTPRHRAPRPRVIIASTDQRDGVPDQFGRARRPAARECRARCPAPVRWSSPVDDDQRLAAHGELQHGAGDDAAAVQPVHHPWLVLHDLDDPAHLVPAAAAGGHVGADQVAVRLGDRPGRLAEIGQDRGSGCRTARSAGARAARSAAAPPARSSRVPSGRPRRARPASRAR